MTGCVHGCGGFLGFYSTVPSSGLAAKLNAADRPFEVQVYDSEKIEKELVTSSSASTLARRFFPASYAKWRQEHPTPAKIFRDKPELICLYCGKDLLQPTPHGIVVIWETNDRCKIEHVYWCCKGSCDRALHDRFYARGLSDGWEDIPDLIVPLIYIRCVAAHLNQLQQGMTYSEEAHENTKKLLLNLFPLVSRDATEDESKRIQSLAAIPSYLGGLGSDE